MAKDHGSSVKNDKQYEGRRKQGMSKSGAAAIANSCMTRQGWWPLRRTSCFAGRAARLPPPFPPFR